MKVAAYVRVSTDRQADRFGPDVQRQAIRAWATAHGHRIPRDAWFADEGESGSNGLESRVGLADALTAVRDGRAAGIVVMRLDRLARDMVLQEQLLAEIRRMGGDVFSTSAAEADFLVDDPEDPSRKLVRVILGSVAEYEKAMVVLRLRSGRRRKAERGGFAYGSPGFGHRADPDTKELTTDDGETAAMLQIAALRASGKSIREIADALEAEGHAPKRSATWNPGTLSRLLKRMSAVTTEASTDIVNALKMAREVNVEVFEKRQDLAPELANRLDLALSRQAQGFRGVLYARDASDKRTGLSQLTEATETAIKVLSQA